MRQLLFLALLASTSTLAADVAVSVTVGDPRFYGQIEIGAYPRPRLIFAQPVVIHAIPAGVVREPRYLRVPPGHEKHWDKHCAEYNACGHPVYFIDDGWYNTVYVPAYKAKHGPPDHAGKGRDKKNKSQGNH